MKTCMDCPTTFTGFGDRCDPCRRRFEKHGPEVDTPGHAARTGSAETSEYERRVHRAFRKDKERPLGDVLPGRPTTDTAALSSDADDIIDIDGVPSCRLCERPMRSLTPAERTRRHRARKRE